MAFVAWFRDGALVRYKDYGEVERRARGGPPAE